MSEHANSTIPCPHCGTPRDVSGVGTPCCVQALLERRPKEELRLFVPADGDPDEVRIWLGGHGSGFVYYDHNDESVVIGIPPGCHLEHRIEGPNTYKDFDPRRDGEWAV